MRKHKILQPKTKQNYVYPINNESWDIQQDRQGLSDHEYSHLPLCFMSVGNRVLWAWDYESKQAPLGGMYR